MSLAYIMDNTSELTIVGEKATYGQLKVCLIPTDKVLYNIIKKYF